MANVEAIRDLLRTNSISKFLNVNARNNYVVAFREMLNELGFSNELKMSSIGSSDYFGNEVVNAVVSFARRNKLDSTGLTVTPFLGATMVERHETLAELKTLEGAIANGQYAQFNLQNSADRNNVVLRSLLQTLGITGTTTQDALRNFALRKGLSSDGYQLTESLAKALLNDLYQLYGDALSKLSINPGTTNPPISGPGNTGNNPGPYAYEPHTNNGGPGGIGNPPATNPAIGNNLQIDDRGGTIVISDGSRQIQFRKHQPMGVSTPGFNSLVAFVEQNKERLVELDLTYSALQVMESIGKNEGRMDAINSYDRGILSIGTFQWTLGRDDKAGELPALLKKFRDQFPDSFRRHFAPLGIDVSQDTKTTYGFLTLNNLAVNTPQAKEQFRDPAWGFHFWRALQEPDFQAVQVEHALDRLKNFYWKPSHAVFGNLLSTVITSAYGVALLLDNHVNRPTWVKPCVELAMQQTGLSNPSTFTDQNERDLIQAYLNVRHTYTDGSIAPMSKSQIRAQAIYADVAAGKLSEARGSFQLSNKAVAAYDNSRGTDKSAFPPVFYEPGEFPDMENERE
ncbi:MAG: hypothetical protein SFV55_29895 [Haliscomenobacter sp.]|uniref:hypothetical protein n=1 Tax=Haliscomenobacter sp. TaxID=2717303 RepID=UPI0029AD4BC8|nr:hypothetical protein [Haliscomenobacter sp.]MDX2072685.1 hypothetical protein [Haliscomenobacter sp.]